MSDEQDAGVSTDEPIVFDRAELPAEAAEPEVAACSACKRALGKDHYTINQAQICEDCHHVLSKELTEAKSGRAFLRAAGLGALAAIGGSVVWYAVAKITGMEIGLLAIAVGYLVGRAVRKGSRSPGGRRYQALAMLLTYLSITGSYIPLVLKTLATQGQADAAAASGSSSSTLKMLPPPDGASVATPPPAPSTAPARPGDRDPNGARGEGPPGVIGVFIALVVVVGIALIAPFLGGMSNILGLVLIGIALYEAWKLNKAATLIVDGPFRTRKAKRAVSAPPPSE